MGYTPAGYVDGGSYTFHFPDGNATIARLLVRALIPGAVPGQRLPRTSSPRAGRLRAARPAGQSRAHPPLQHRACARATSAIRPPRAAWRSPTRAASRRLRVRAKACVLACWNMMIPYLVPGAARARRRRRCTSWSRRRWSTPAWRCATGRRSRSSASPASPRRAAITPRSALNSAGGHRRLRPPSARPTSRSCVHMVRTPCQPGPAGARAEPGRPRGTAGDAVRDLRAQHPRPARPHPGRRRLRSGARHRRHHRQSLAARLCAGIQSAVRAGPAAGRSSPTSIGRARFGRIAIANSDAGAAAYTDSAIDQAHRAVDEPWLCHRRSDRARSEQPTFSPASGEACVMQTG